MALPEQILSGKPYPLKVLLGFGINYRMWPDFDFMAHCLERLDFAVNTDLFMTDTCRYCDLILSACSSLERPVTEGLSNSRSPKKIPAKRLRNTYGQDRILLDDLEQTWLFRLTYRPCTRRSEGVLLYSEYKLATADVYPYTNVSRALTSCATAAANGRLKFPRCGCSWDSTGRPLYDHNPKSTDSSRCQRS